MFPYFIWWIYINLSLWNIYFYIPLALLTPVQKLPNQQQCSYTLIAQPSQQTHLLTHSMMWRCLFLQHLLCQERGHSLEITFWHKHYCFEIWSNKIFLPVLLYRHKHAYRVGKILLANKVFLLYIYFFPATTITIKNWLFQNRVIITPLRSFIDTDPGIFFVWSSLLSRNSSIHQQDVNVTSVLCISTCGPQRRNSGLAQVRCLPVVMNNFQYLSFTSCRPC